MGADMTESPSEFPVPPLVLDYDVNWVSVALSGDLGAWAKVAAQDTLRRDERKPSGRAVRQLADHLEAAGALARRPGDAMVALLLCPGPARRTLTAIRLVAVELEETDLADPLDAARRIVDPEGLPVVEPVEITELDSPAGRVVRGRARMVGAEPERHVSEGLNYAWVIPPYRYAAVLTTAFSDLVVAGQWRSTVDALAAAVALEQPL